MRLKLKGKNAGSKSRDTVKVYYPDIKGSRSAKANSLSNLRFTYFATNHILSPFYNIASISNSSNVFT